MPVLIFTPRPNKLQCCLAFLVLIKSVYVFMLITCLHVHTQCKTRTDTNITLCKCQNKFSLICLLPSCKCEGRCMVSASALLLHPSEGEALFFSCCVVPGVHVGDLPPPTLPPSEGGGIGSLVTCDPLWLCGKTKSFHTRIVPSFTGRGSGGGR